MIIYGTRGSHYATPNLPGSVCPSCKKFGTLNAGLVSRYAHIYWIPLFPYQKLAVVQCANCRASWEGQALPAELTEDVQAAKSQAHHPYWTWSGLVLIVVLAVAGVVAGLRDTRTDDTYLESPRAGDIYTVRLDSADQYSLLKVRQVSGNSVELVANEYQTSDSSPINSLNEPAKYSQEPFVVTRFDLQIMRRKGELTDVDRP